MRAHNAWVNKELCNVCFCNMWFRVQGLTETVCSRRLRAVALFSSKLQGILKDGVIGDSKALNPNLQTQDAGPIPGSKTSKPLGEAMP